MTLVMCDLGGTNCRFTTPDGGGGIDRDRIVALKNDDFTDFLSALQAYRNGAGIGPIEQLIVALAAPALASEVQLTNRDWVLSKHELSTALEGAEVAFLNDLQAVALGLDATGLRTRRLNEGHPDPLGNRLVVNFGTGFNTAVLAPDRTVLACEAGHATFPAETAFDRQLQDWAGTLYGRCSLDRVLSGSGLVAIHDLVRGEQSGKTSHAILTAALRGDDGDAVQACHEFCRIAGRATGDHALTFFATGGVWISGGLGRALWPLLNAPDSGFLQNCFRKGRMQALAEALPIYVIEGDEAPLFGCLQFARARM